MAELEPGHPDELRTLLTNWLNQANDPMGTLLPPGITPTEWAVRQFINSWRKSVRSSIDSIENSLQEAHKALNSCNVASAKYHVESATQTLNESLRDDLGLYEWNRESE
jgi:hypothetical protein